MKHKADITAMRIALAVFFIVLGVIGVIPRLQESVFSLNDNLGLEIFFGIIEIICGLILAAGLFSLMKKKVISLALLVILCFWLLRLFLSKLLWGLSFSNHGLLFRPSFSVWLLVFTAEIVIATAIYAVYRNEA